MSRQDFDRLREEKTAAKQRGENTALLDQALLEAAKRIGRKRTKKPRINLA